MGFFNDKIIGSFRPEKVETVTISGEEARLKLDELTEYNERFPEPSTEEQETLPQKYGSPAYITYLICLIEFAERASYYGVKGRLNNFIQRSLPTGGNGAGAVPSGSQQNAGALGLGLQVASAITLLLTFLAYLTPLWGGYLADKTYGRLKTIWHGIWIGGVSHIILIVAAIPSVITGGAALAPTIISILTLAIATGFIKPNLLPLLLDQYPHDRDYVKTKDNGAKIIVSRSATIERVTLIFYWSINVGAFLSLATAYCAKRVGFWLAYLIPGIIYFIMIPVLLYLSPKLKHDRPTGISIIGESAKVLRYSLKSGWISRAKNGTFWDFAKPSSIENRGEVSVLEETDKKGKKRISWTDQFVEDVRQTVEACKIFAFFIIYNINDGGIGGIENSLSASMTTDGLPNDLLSTLNPITIIVAIPLLNNVVYPALRRFKIEFPPVYRIFVGFILASLSQVVGAILQWKVYKTSPCGYYATDCSVGTGVSPLSAWIYVVLPILGALSECFANTAAYEIAYTRAPEYMKGLVVALFLFTSSISAAVSEAATAALIDPYLIWPFAACAIVGVIAAVIFLWLFRDLADVMERERIIKEGNVKQEYLGKIHERDNAPNTNLSSVDELVSEKTRLKEEIISVDARESALETKKY